MTDSCMFRGLVLGMVLLLASLVPPVNSQSSPIPLGRRQAQFPDFVVVGDKGEEFVLLFNRYWTRSSYLWDDRLFLSYPNGFIGDDRIVDIRKARVARDGFVELPGPRFTDVIVMGGGFTFVPTRKPFNPKVVADRIGRLISKYGELDGYAFLDDGIKSIAAWSELTETSGGRVIHYRSDNLRHAFVAAFHDFYSVSLNNLSPPWAEEVPGPGLGGTIDVEFTRATTEINVLNGYVDLTKRHLYKENNRLKTIRIDSESPAFSTTHTFDDVVRFHEVPLPLATTKVRITILEVYKGTKYDDTCVTKIFIPQRELRPRAEYEAEIERSLRDLAPRHFK